MKNYLKDLKKKKKGFTLIELIIVLAILAILGAIAVPNLISVRNNARARADRTSESALASTVQALISDEQIETPTGSNTKTFTINGSVNVPTGATYTGDATTIQNALSTVPVPQSGHGDFTVTINSNGNVTVGPNIP